MMMPVIPEELLPYDRNNKDQVESCLFSQIRQAIREGKLNGYEDVDLALLSFLVDCGLPDEHIHSVFQSVFDTDYDNRRTSLMIERTQQRKQAGDPVVGTGSFIQRLKELGLDEAYRFARELQSGNGVWRISLKDEWPDPVPLDDYSLLPGFPVDVFTGMGQQIIEEVSDVNQVDAGLTGCLYLSALSTCLAKKARVDLISHPEPLNIYTCAILDSGNRKSSTAGDMTRPLYAYQAEEQERMRTVIQEAKSTFAINEKRLEKLQKRAANTDDPEVRRRLEEEAATLARELIENPVPETPVYLLDDVTPEKLGDLMAHNGERQAVISPEGGLFEIMAGRYSKDGQGNLDLFLKAHSGDYWSVHRVGRGSAIMESPALTLGLAVQSEVIEEVGKNLHFRGKGLSARFLFSLCKSLVGYRSRQTKALPPSLIHAYRQEAFSLMDIPITKSNLRLVPDGQELWNRFYNDVEQEMRPGGSLYYIKDWGSKLPGAVARIAGLLHLAEHKERGLALPISVNIVSASCVIGGYFLEHAIAVFGLMQEDPRIRLARQILDYLKRIRPETFTGRDVLRHTSIAQTEDVLHGIKILLDRGFIREESPEQNRTGRPKGQVYRTHPTVRQSSNI